MRFLSVFFLLAACAPSEPLFKPFEVEVPVSVSCQAPPVEKPDFALNRATVSDDIAEKTKAALIELNQRRAYETLLESLVSACL